MMKIFVAGTDTEIGKTLVSGALLHKLGEHGLNCVGMKPVAAGAVQQDGAWCNEDVMALNAASKVKAPAQLINPYLFKQFIAPHIAAKNESRRIELATILDSYQQLMAHAEAIVVEGVGGFCVPLNEQEDSADLTQRLNLPVILVVGMRLGCINHALLTVEAVAARGLRLAGWVANSAQQEMAYLHENVAALRERIAAPLLGCIPWLENPSAEKAAKYLDLTELLVAAR